MSTSYSLHLAFLPSPLHAPTFLQQALTLPLLQTAMYPPFFSAQICWLSLFFPNSLAPSLPNHTLSAPLPSTYMILLLLILGWAPNAALTYYTTTVATCCLQLAADGPSCASADSFFFAGHFTIQFATLPNSEIWGMWDHAICSVAWMVNGPSQ